MPVMWVPVAGQARLPIISAMCHGDGDGDVFSLHFARLSVCAIENS